MEDDDMHLNVNSPRYCAAERIASHSSVREARASIASSIEEGKRELMAMNRALDSAPDRDRRRRMFEMALRGDESYRDLMTDEELRRAELLEHLITLNDVLSKFGAVHSTLVN